MRARYLGDSYDLVKRVWAESLGSIGRLYPIRSLFLLVSASSLQP